MPESQEENRHRLFTLDASLRAEADRMLEESGLGEIIRGVGYKAVGSYVMRTMTWRDLDFERCDESPDWQAHWELGLRFARNGWVWAFDCVDAWRDPRQMKDAGYFWGLRAVRPGQRDFWKIDCWTAPREEFERSAPARPVWDKRLNDETRYHVLAIKDEVCKLPEYRDTILSVHIYEAVLENNVRSIDEFWEWWRERDSK